ncbi:MAG: hypothetical protein WKF79_11305 [Nocardioides sp.]
MTFDVEELTARAETLKQKAIDTYVAMAMRGGGREAAYNASTYQRAAEDTFADVSSIYDDFLGSPAPEDFVWATDNLEAAMSKLATAGYTEDPVGEGNAMGSANTDLTGVVTSGDYMADWTGDAASTYKTNFADKFIPVSSNQFVLTSVVRNAINAEAAIWQTVRDDLDRLSQDAINKMEECLDKSPSDWSAAITVAAAVVSVVAVPLTGGSSLALGFAAVGAGLGVAATGMGGEGGEEEQLGLEAGSPPAIIDSLTTALGKISTHITEHENLIHEQMNSTASEINGGWDRLCLPRPAMADADSHRYDDPRYTGQSNA